MERRALYWAVAATLTPAAILILMCVAGAVIVPVTALVRVNEGGDPGTWFLLASAAAVMFVMFTVFIVIGSLVTVSKLAVVGATGGVVVGEILKRNRPAGQVEPR